MIVRFFLPVLAFAGLTACVVEPAKQAPAPSPSYAPANHAEPGRTFSEAAAALCRTSGGMIAPRGRMQTEYCLHALPDAGKVCSDKADCTGKCLTSETGLAAGASATGTCQPDNGPIFGCHAEIIGGKAAAALCVD